MTRTSSLSEDGTATQRSSFTDPATAALDLLKPPRYRIIFHVGRESHLEPQALVGGFAGQPPVRLFAIKPRSALPGPTWQVLVPPDIRPELESLLALSASLRRIARGPHRPRGPCRESRVSVCDSTSTSGRRDRQVGRRWNITVLMCGRRSGSHGFAAIFAANVWTAILPSLIRNVSVPNTMSADAQFACHTM